MTIENHQRFHVAHAHLGMPFGSDRFGKLAEVTARFLGTPQYLIGQSLIVLLWRSTRSDSQVSTLIHLSC